MLDGIQASAFVSGQRFSDMHRRLSTYIKFIQIRALSGFADDLSEKRNAFKSPAWDAGEQKLRSRA